MPDYSKYKTTTAEPEASSMIETFRAIGYSIQGAVADIIDNSISAGAKQIWIDFEWEMTAEYDGSALARDNRRRFREQQLEDFKSGKIQTLQFI